MQSLFLYSSKFLFVSQLKEPITEYRNKLQDLSGVGPLQKK